jgi:hypothetical protein
MAHILKEFLTWRARETMEGGGFLPPPRNTGPACREIDSSYFAYCLLAVSDQERRRAIIPEQAQSPAPQRQTLLQRIRTNNTYSFFVIIFEMKVLARLLLFGPVDPEILPPRPFRIRSLFLFKFLRGRLAWTYHA